MARAERPPAAPQRPRGRPKGLARGWGHRRNWVPVAAYVGFVVLVGAGLFAWDRAYEARQQALFAPAAPDVVVRNLIESVVGRGTVTDVKLDQRAGTLNVTVKDVLVKPGQSLDEKKKNLSTEGTLAIQFVESRFRFKVMTVHLVQDGTVLATVTASGQSAPKTEYAPDLK
ncbi:MAG TPA: hypothetical protein VKW09_13690 [bacterium]|nr:hypothetical protein [bacterium]